MVPYIRKQFAAWWNEQKTYPNGLKTTRGQSIVFVLLSCLALAVMVPVCFLVLFFLVSQLGHESAGDIAGHAVKLGILALL